jgi:hypothetical protein
MKAKHDMKCSLTWILTSLMLIGLLGLASMSLAAEDTWTTKADMPTARATLSTSVVNGRIYAIGGSMISGAAGLPTMEEYDPATDTWAKKTDMPTGRIWVSASAVNGKIYVIGGKTAPNAQDLSTVEEYDTGFVPELITSVEAEGKLATTWGEVKCSR